MKSTDKYGTYFNQNEIHPISLEANRKNSMSITIKFVLASATFAIISYVAYRMSFGAAGISGSSISSDTVIGRDFDFNQRPKNIPALIRKATVLAHSTGALQSLPTVQYHDNNAVTYRRSTTTLEYDSGMEFIISLPYKYSNSSLIKKQKFSNIDSMSIDSGKEDPLDVETIEDELVVLRFAPLTHQEYSIVLNKFNSIPDHCLLLTDKYQPQILPLDAEILELWYWILKKTSAVGFYNSNALAGASQAHRHMQFVPLQHIWSLRNEDAPHPLPIDDFIVPQIDSGHWSRFPVTRPSLGGRSKGSFIYSSSEVVAIFVLRFCYFAYYLLQIGLYFEHYIAVLYPRGYFSKFGSSAVRHFGGYLESVYEALLAEADISKENLRSCAGEISAPLIDSTGTTRKKKHFDCVNGAETAYNFIMTESYMLLVPRTAKNYHFNNNEYFEINSFGFLGMLMASSDAALERMRQVGPLNILSKVGRGE